MCRGGGRPRAADTSAQEAELRRQNEILLQQAQLDRDLQRELFERQRAEEQARHDAIMLAQTTEAERRLAAEQAAAAEYRAQQEALFAQMEDERRAQEQLAQERADRATAYAEGRRARVDAARDDINSLYSGFDDAYFDNFRNDYVSAYKPQIETDYRERVRSNRLSLADRGNLNSTAAASFFGDLARERARKEAELSGTAANAAQSFRTAIDGQRSDDINALLGSAFISQQDLPDGVTDVSDALAGIDAEIGLLSGDARRRAMAITRPTFAGGFNSDLGGEDVGGTRVVGGNRVVSNNSRTSTPFGPSYYAVGG